jgi:concanavalin A-like lectin/glucanase superfamily protein
VRALLVLLLVGCETGGPPDFSAKLVAHYPMEDTAAGKVADTSGNHRDGACTTCPTVEAGKVGMAFRFDGGDQQVDVDPAAAFNEVVRGFSAAAWIKLDMAPPQLPGCAMVKGAMWSICVTPELNPAFGSFSATTTVTVGEWHHFAISYDGKVKRIVVDGSEVGMTAASITSEPGQLVLGAELIGLADDAQVYSGVLTDEEIAALVTP